MNEGGALFLVASILAVFSVPFVFSALVMRLVGRISKGVLIFVLALDAVLWGMALFYWFVLLPSLDNAV